MSRDIIIDFLCLSHRICLIPDNLLRKCSQIWSKTDMRELFPQILFRLFPLSIRFIRFFLFPAQIQLFGGFFPVPVFHLILKFIFHLKGLPTLIFCLKADRSLKRRRRSHLSTLRTATEICKFLHLSILDRKRKLYLNLCALSSRRRTQRCCTLDMNLASQTSLFLHLVHHIIEHIELCSAIPDRLLIEQTIAKIFPGLDQVVNEIVLEFDLPVDADPLKRSLHQKIIEFLIFKICKCLLHHIDRTLPTVRILLWKTRNNLPLKKKTLSQRLRKVLFKTLLNYPLREF